MVKELLNNEVNDIKCACLDTRIVYLIIIIIIMPDRGKDTQLHFFNGICYRILHLVTVH